MACPGREKSSVKAEVSRIPVVNVVKSAAAEKFARLGLAEVPEIASLSGMASIWFPFGVDG